MGILLQEETNETNETNYTKPAIEGRRIPCETEVNTNQRIKNQQITTSTISTQDQPNPTYESFIGLRVKILIIKNCGQALKGGKNRL